MLIQALVPLLLSIAAWAQPAPAGPAAYRADIERWRARHEAALRADDGWLTVVGLFWLKEGPNSIGTTSESDIAFPIAPGRPARIGVVTLTRGRVTFEAASGVSTRVNGQPSKRAELRADGPDGPDRATIGTLTWFVIQRGDRYAIRLRDSDSPLRRAFPGTTWFPIDARYRVKGRWIPNPTPKTISIQNVLGMLDEYESPGTVEFTLDGQRLRLDPVPAGSSGRLFFIFKDRTAGRSTYPAGRFLYADPPLDGAVTLDFNRAENPPCAVTPHATCPLPPRQNQLRIAIPAGETYTSHQ